MTEWIIEGGVPLCGTVPVQGSKNAVLPILAATVLSQSPSEIHGVPNLKDVHVMVEILRALGMEVTFDVERQTIWVDPHGLSNGEVPEALMSQMRSSIFLMGPLCARLGRAVLSQPGGCSIGTRPIDLHLKAMRALGVRIARENARLICQCGHLRAATILLDYPSVGATENALMAAVLADGVSTIFNAAREPEVVDLEHFLVKMGAQIEGIGTDTLTIRGVSQLHGVVYDVIADRIVVGTLAVYAAITRGSVRLTHIGPEHLLAVTDKLQETGSTVVTDGTDLLIRAQDRPKAIERLETAPYPGFPTDMQACMMALLAIADGVSVIVENVFEDRFKHVPELNRMGAHIWTDLKTAVVRGVPHLTGAQLEADDLRGAAALIGAGLAASGTTIVRDAGHVDRGYADWVDLLGRLGARVKRRDP
ncbi:MAG: UDP-N-acetylglucosamine 1-carboxyvinyltransferase [Firmicutes bacterium]|nr:UDP-N-acetylglucosamine 1-carboxyvinyltransferase [Bacillota bacterium]